MIKEVIVLTPLSPENQALNLQYLFRFDNKIRFLFKHFYLSCHALIFSFQEFSRDITKL